MTFDSILTIIAITIAIYSLLPRHRRLELSLKIKLFDKLYLALAVLLVHYLLFYDTFKKLNLSLNIGLSKWSLNPNNISYIIVVLISIFLSFRLSKMPIPKSRIRKYKELLDELINLGRIPELISSLEKNLNRVYRIHRSDFFIYKIRKNLNKKVNPTVDGKILGSQITEIESLIRNFEDDDFKKIDHLKREGRHRINHCFAKIKSSIIDFFLRLLPSNEKNVEVTYELFRSLMNSDKFINGMINVKPYFGIDLLKIEIYHKHDFFEKYLKRLFFQTDSILYYELNNSSNVDSQLNYHIPNSNKLLSFLLEDANNAYDLYAWKPVGEFIIKFLEDLNKSNKNDPNNLPFDYLDENLKWKNPLFCGIFFFDIMVSKALHKKVQWHMWLYYFQHWTEKICQNYNPDKKYVDLNSEFPTTYSYLLYEIISTIRGWIKFVEYAENDQSNCTIKNNDLQTENGSIIKCSILCLGRCIGTIVTCESITKRFKNYIVEMVYNLYFDIRGLKNKEIYHKVLLNSIINQGGIYGSISHEYLGTLIATFIEYDTIPYNTDHVDEVIKKLFYAYYDNYGVENLDEYLTYELNDDAVILSTQYGGNFTIKIPYP